MFYQGNQALIEDIIQSATSIMGKQGYSESHIKKHKSIYRRLSQFSQERFDGKYSFEVGESFMQTVSQCAPPLSAQFFRTYVVAIQRLNRTLENDKNWCPQSKPPMEYAGSRFFKKIPKCIVLRIGVQTPLLLGKKSL